MKSKTPAVKFSGHVDIDIKATDFFFPRCAHNAIWGIFTEYMSRPDVQKEYKKWHKQYKARKKAAANGNV